MFKNSLQLVREISFPRSVKAADGENPVLVILSDGSREAFGATAYIRWRTDNDYESTLLVAKSRIAPLKVIETLRLELCGAVLNSRLYAFIQKRNA